MAGKSPALATPFINGSKIERFMKRCLACDAVFEDEAWKCRGCGFEPAERDGIVRFSENPAAVRVGYRPEYFAKLAGLESEHFWFRARNRLIQWALREFFPEARCFFEIGCGTGFVLQGLSNSHSSLQLRGSDLFADGLAFARGRVPAVELYQMDARHIPFSEEFDVIGAFDVLEHVVEDVAVLEQMFRATRPGGGILLTVPQHRSLWSASDVHAQHQRRYGRAELRRKVEGAGFKVEFVTSFVSFLLPPMLLSRVKRKRLKNFDPWRELKVSRSLNTAFETILGWERALIRRGLSLPAGGSLLLVARRASSL